MHRFFDRHGCATLVLMVAAIGVFVTYGPGPGIENAPGLEHPSRGRLQVCIAEFGDPRFDPGAAAWLVGSVLSDQRSRPQWRQRQLPWLWANVALGCPTEPAMAVAVARGRTATIDSLETFTRIDAPSTSPYLVHLVVIPESRQGELLGRSSLAQRSVRIEQIGRTRSRAFSVTNELYLTDREIVDRPSVEYALGYFLQLGYATPIADMRDPTVVHVPALPTPPRVFSRTELRATYTARQTATARRGTNDR
ncbi:MAG: hypothetical protein U0821_20360 [Chloroflexota bacterium]